jgi:RNA-binding motif X-linked protein 2
VIDINMPRDRETHQAKGFSFLMYEDQRSTVLAVDNLNGSKVLGRTLRVDHVRSYRHPDQTNAEGERVEEEEPTYNAMPPTIGGDGKPYCRFKSLIDCSSCIRFLPDDSDGSSDTDRGDEEDPMAAYIREQKREKKKAKKEKSEDKGGKKKRKREGETKEEKAARKKEKKERKEREESRVEAKLEPSEDRSAIPRRDIKRESEHRDLDARRHREDRYRDRYSPAREDRPSIRAEDSRRFPSRTVVKEEPQVDWRSARQDTYQRDDRDYSEHAQSSRGRNERESQRVMRDLDERYESRKNGAGGRHEMDVRSDYLRGDGGERRRDYR